MLSDWKVDLTEMTVEHIAGYRIKRGSFGDVDSNPNWFFESGELNDEILKEGILCFEHHYAKAFLNRYLEDLLTLEKIVDVANKYIQEKSYGDCITTLQLERYLKDQDFFPINTISIIRGAVYFYKKEFGSGKE